MTLWRQRGEPWTPQAQAVCSAPALSRSAAEGSGEKKRSFPVVFSPGAESDSQWLDTLGLDFGALPGEEGGQEGEEREEVDEELAPGEGQEGSHGGIKRRSAVEKKRRKRIRSELTCHTLLNNRAPCCAPYSDGPVPCSCDVAAMSNGMLPFLCCRVMQ